MSDIIITGASRGIGRALALALVPSGSRLVLVARDEARLEVLARELGERGQEARVVVGDLSSKRGAHALGEALLAEVRPGAMLVHNAGLWPTRCVLNEEGLETSFVVNHLGPLVMQRELLARGGLSRLLVVSAGLIAKGRFDAVRTPIGADFSRFGTYARTKLAFAIATRDLARAHPELDVRCLHPGVVATDLGDTRGVIGVLLRFAKRFWETPEVCATRLAVTAREPRWSTPGDATWAFEGRESGWPASASDAANVRAVREATERYL